MKRVIIGFALNTRGSAGLLAVITMALLGVMGAALLGLSKTEIAISTSYRDGMAAQYLAEAGAKRALVELAADSGWTGGSETGLGAAPTSGSYSIKVDKAGASRTITSTGAVNQARRQVVLKVTVASGSGLKVGDNVLFAGGSILFKKNNTVEGSIASNGGIGDVTVSGTKTPYAELAFPAYAASTFSSSGSKLSLGESLLLAGNADGKYYLDSAFTGSNISGSGTVYIKGSWINESNDIKISSSSFIFVIVEGDVGFKNNVVIENGVLLGKQDVTFKNNASINGAVIAGQTLEFKNNSDSVYNAAVIRKSGLPVSTPFSVDLWNYH